MVKTTEATMTDTGFESSVNFDESQARNQRIVTVRNCPGGRIRLLRMKLNVSLEKLGHLSGMSHKRITKFEKYMLEPLPTEISKLADALRIPTEWITDAIPEDLLL
jgi:DNA-binding transcriptional regulator YiaG